MRGGSKGILGDMQGACTDLKQAYLLGHKDGFNRFCR